MERLYHLYTGGADSLSHLNVVEEALGHVLKRVLGPGCKPINSRAVHKRREVTHSVSQSVSYRTEGKHDVQEFLAALDEISKDLCVCGFLQHAFVLGDVTHDVHNFLSFVSLEDVGHFTRV